jgi:hypothetical protein
MEIPFGGGKNRATIPDAIHQARFSPAASFQSARRIGRLLPDQLEGKGHVPQS